MRIFVAGASGLIGSRLVRLLSQQGHTVAAMTRSPEKVDALEAIGAEALVCDVFDGDRLTGAVGGFRPDVLVDELTDLPDDLAEIGRFRERNDRIRREGTRNILDAAARARVGRVISQSIAWELPRDRGGEAVIEHEKAVLEHGGVVVRYAQLYGPGTFYPDDLPAPPRVHVEDAARLTLHALDVRPGTILAIEDGPDGGAARRAEVREVDRLGRHG